MCMKMRWSEHTKLIMWTTHRYRWTCNEVSLILHIIQNILYLCSCALYMMQFSNAISANAVYIIRGVSYACIQCKYLLLTPATTCEKLKPSEDEDEAGVVAKKTIQFQQIYLKHNKYVYTFLLFIFLFADFSLTSSYSFSSSYMWYSFLFLFHIYFYFFFIFSSLNFQKDTNLLTFFALLLTFSQLL